MGDPEEYLPDCSIDDVASELNAIGFPKADVITRLNVGASYHRIFRLKYTASTHQKIVQKCGLNPATSTGVSEDSFILRISGPHIPKIKTDNEVGILAYLTKHTSIPVPHIIHYDDTTLNAFGNEYMIMSLLSGHIASDSYLELSQIQFSHILDQLVTMCLDLYRLDFSHIGGLKPDLNTETSKFPQQLTNLPLIPGPPIMETMWQTPDIDRHFNNIPSNLDCPPASSHTQSLATLNAVSPTGYPSYTTWLTAQMNTYINAITAHPSLSWILSTNPDLKPLHQFIDKITNDTLLQSKLNDVPLKLAHRDLHFGNILLSPVPVTHTNTNTDSKTSTNHETQYTITGLLDWEFAAILPFPLWRSSFLWDGIRTPPASFTSSSSSSSPNPDSGSDAKVQVQVEAEWRIHSRRNREILYEQWTSKVVARGEEGTRMLRDMEWRNGEQEAAWKVVNFLRCVVEVCPRGKQTGDARVWWGEVRKALGVFGIES